MSQITAPSELVRIARGWAGAHAQPPGGTGFADGLGLWVGAFDAIGLQAAQHAASTLNVRATAAGRAALQDLPALLSQVRDTLLQSIGVAPNPLGEDSYAPYQRRHQELQWQMGQKLGQARERARLALSRCGVLRLARLALMDAALDPVIARREQATLARLPVLLERRFQEARARGDRPGFEAEWHDTLRAEWALRLEPLDGLVAAAHEEIPI